MRGDAGLPSQFSLLTRTEREIEVNPRCCWLAGPRPIAASSLIPEKRQPIDSSLEKLRSHFREHNFLSFTHKRSNA